MRIYLLALIILILNACQKQDENQPQKISKELPIKVTQFASNSSDSYTMEYDSDDRLTKITIGTTVFFVEYSPDNKVIKFSRDVNGQYIALTYTGNQVKGEIFYYDSYQKKFPNTPGVEMQLELNARGQLVKIATNYGRWIVNLSYDDKGNLTQSDKIYFDNNYHITTLYKNFDNQKHPFSDINNYQLIYFLNKCTQGAFDGDAWLESQFFNNPKSTGFAFTNQKDTIWANSTFEYNSKGYLTKRTNLLPRISVYDSLKFTYR